MERLNADGNSRGFQIVGQGPSLAKADDLRREESAVEPGQKGDEATLNATDGQPGDQTDQAERGTHERSGRKKQGRVDEPLAP